MHKLGGLLLIFLLVVGVYAEDTKEPQLPDAPPKKKSVEYRPETVLPEPKLPEAPAKKKSTEYRPGIDLPDVRLPDAPPKKESPAYQPDLNLLRLQLPEVKTGQGILNLSDFSGGLNLKAFPTQLKDNEAQVLEDVEWNKLNALCRRKGYTRWVDSVYTETVTVALPVSGLYIYKDPQWQSPSVIVGMDSSLQWSYFVSNQSFQIWDFPTQGGIYNFTSFRDTVIITYSQADHPPLWFYKKGSPAWLSDVDSIGDWQYDIVEKRNSVCEPAQNNPCTTVYTLKDVSLTTDELVGYLVHPSGGAYGLVISNTSNDVYVAQADTYTFPSNPKLRIFAWWNEGLIDSGTVDSVQEWNYRTRIWAADLPSWSASYFGSILEITNGDTTVGIAHCPHTGTADYWEFLTYFYPDITTGTTYKIYYKYFYKMKYCAKYQNCLFLANDSTYPGMIYFSKQNEWNNFNTTNLLILHLEKGEEITGMVSLYNDIQGFRDSRSDELLVFTHTSVYTIGGTYPNFTLNKLSSGIGCVAPLSIVNVEGRYVAFMSRKGLYACDGNKVFKLPGSEKIEPVLDGINKVNISKVNGGYWDDHLYISFPESSATTANKTLIYNINLNSFSRANIKSSCWANSSDKDDTIGFYFGHPDSGIVYRYGTSDFDDGDIITLTFKSKEFDIDLMQQERFVQLYLSYDQTTTNLTTLNFYKDFGTTPTWTKTLSGTGKTVDKVFISPDIYGKTLSWGLESKDPDITIGDVNIKFHLMGGY